MKVFKGIKAAPGVVVGPVVKLQRGEFGLHRIVSDPNRERALFDAAVVLAKDELRGLMQKAQGPEADIFIFQIALLEDNSFTSEIGDYIGAGAGSAAAVERAEQIFAARLDNVDDAYIRERSVDVRDACRRVVDILDGRPHRTPQLNVPSILAAEWFFPSDILSVERSMILGFISDEGSYTSHAAIMARTMGIPALCRMGEGVAAELDGHRIVLNATACTVTMDPGAAELADTKQKLAAQDRRNKKQDALAARPCITKDGTGFELWATCNNADEVEAAMASGAAGASLHTDVMMMQRPDEEQQYAQYLACLRAAGGAPLVVHTFDIEPPSADMPTPGREGLGSLGMHGARLLVRERALFDNQIYALLRAGTKGELRVVLTMIGGPEDWDDCMREIERCKEHLRRRGVPFDEKLSFGSLIEVPAAALLADEIMDHGAQFLAIGSNDLVQFTCAADRFDSAVARYYRPASAGVAKLVQMVCKEAKQRKKKVYLCGVLAEIPKTAESYLRMGIRNFSMEPACIPEVKTLLRGTDLSTKNGAEKRRKTAAAQS